ncbi:MAG: glycoprotease, partial [Ruthenibacterium sp.]
MLTLGIDTSNYATSLAVLCADTKEVVCATKRFLPVKQGELGLRQSDAVFHHTQALPELLHEISEQCELSHVGAVGVSARPRPVEGSYMPCFLTGVAAATAFALGRGVLLCKTTHQQGHIAAALYATGDEALFYKQTLVFHLSGGTTELLLCKDGQVLCKVGESTDLYAGQAVDRIGVKLGFAFPAGAEVSALAETCAEAMHP